MINIADNIKSVLSEIEAAARQAGRDPSEIKLIAVSKTKPMELLLDAYNCGHRDFGENRPQEIAEKFPQFDGGDVSFHMIGHLQKNKVRMIIDKVCLIHSVDSLGLAKEINKRAAAIDKIQDILIQVNISGEESKSGVSPYVAPLLCREISLLPNIRIKGLMTISIKDLDYDGNRWIFEKLKELAKGIDSEKIDNVSMKELSMGMTHDYRAAIDAGSTMIRVGTAIFGERDYANL